jgi:hypothetical protein
VVLWRPVEISASVDWYEVTKVLIGPQDETWERLSDLFVPYMRRVVNEVSSSGFSTVLLEENYPVE